MTSQLETNEQGLTAEEEKELDDFLKKGLYVAIWRVVRCNRCYLQGVPFEDLKSIALLVVAVGLNKWDSTKRKSISLFSYLYSGVQRFTLTHFFRENSHRFDSYGHHRDITIFNYDDGGSLPETSLTPSRCVRSSTEPKVEYSVEELMAIIRKDVKDRDADVIKMRVFGGMTLEEVGMVLGVTKERARQLEERGLRQIRAAGSFTRAELDA